MDVSTHKRQKTHKRMILDQIRAARSIQLQWRTYTQALTQGLSPQQAGIQARSRFNCWYWSTSKHLSSLKTFEDIAKVHKSMLQVDHRINSLILNDSTPTNFMKWFRSPKAHQNNQATKARNLLPKFVKDSNQLLVKIKALENEIKRMSEKELMALPQTAVVMKSSKFRLIRNVDSCVL